jgi:hypothetical protein
LEENNKLRYNDPIHALYMTTAACWKQQNTKHVNFIFNTIYVYIAILYTYAVQS